MFCQHCGNEIREGLNYCNRCGARSVTDLERTNMLAKCDTLMQTLSIAIGFTGFAGVVALGYTINQLIFRGEIPPPAFLLVVVLGAVVLGVVITLSLLIGLLYRKNSTDALRFGADGAAKQMPQSPPAPLLDFQQPIFGVTENTTRNFDPVFAPKKES